MTEDECRGYPIGAKVTASDLIGPPYAGVEYTVTAHRCIGSNRYFVVTDRPMGLPGTEPTAIHPSPEMVWEHRRSLVLLSTPSATAAWFDAKLSPKPGKPEWKPDEGIDWEAHRGFMKGL